MLDLLPTGAVLLDQRARIVGMNPQWRTLADASGLADAQHGLGLSYLKVCESVATCGAGPAVGRAIRSLLRGDGDSFSMDYVRPTSAGARWFEVRATPLRGVEPARLLVAHTDVTDRKRAPAVAATADAKLHDGLEEERRRIARELHDTSGQDMAAAALLLGRAIPMVSPTSEVRPLLDEALALCRKVLDDVRTLSYDLRPPVLDAAGLPEALRWYAQVFSRRSGIRLEVEAPRELQRRCPDAEMALFRVAQEALSNVQRHSRAATAAITLTRAGDALELEVRDPGGSATRTCPPALLAGQGTQCMNDRIRACGGTLAVRSDERGTVLTATAPIAAEETS